jgi:glycosyltransferase involved in cell wall biosynthesis
MARQISERLVSDLGWKVDVYTTTAQSHHTWKKAYAVGTEQINNVTIRRYDCTINRTIITRILAKLVFQILKLLRWTPFSKVINTMERFWFVLQGPYSPSLVAAVKANARDYDHIIFFTYLYFPTLRGVLELEKKSILVPLAHAEPPFYFEIMDKVFRRAGILLTNTPPESALIRSRFPNLSTPIIEAGLGVDFPEPQAQSSTENLQIDEPYCLYLGRISTEKNVHELIAWYTEFANANHIRTPRLVLAGNLDSRLTIPTTPLVSYIGYVNDDARIELIRNAICLINPSTHESLSMIVLEALALSVPVLVNQNCAVLNYYVASTTTSFGYRGKDSFVRQLHEILGTDWRAANHRQSLEDSSKWVRSHFSWTRVLDIYSNLSTLC